MVVSFMNTYWRFVYQQILPATRSVWEPMFVRESNHFLERLPIDALLLGISSEEADAADE